MGFVFLIKRYLAIVACWVLLIFLFIAFFPFSDIEKVDPGTIKIECPEGRIGYCRTIKRYDHKMGISAFDISFDSLTTENGEAGLFKTASQRILNIDKLRFIIFDNSIPEEETHSENSSDIVKKTFPKSQGRDIKQLKKVNTADNNSGDSFVNDISKKVIKMISNKEQYGVYPDVSFKNISRIFVNDFHYANISNDVLKIEIESKTARTSLQETGLVLRGHVVIKTGSGAKLQCNHVIWDIKNSKFDAKGVYALSNKGDVKTGKDICLDISLNQVQI